MRGPISALQAPVDLSVGEPAAVRAGAVVPWRALSAAALLSLALGAALWLGLAGGRASLAPGVRSGAYSREGLLGLPLAAQGPVSAALGAHDPSYLVRWGRAGLHAVSGGQGLAVSFARSGVSVRVGASRLSLALAAAGYDGRLRAVGAATPRANGNRVSYARGAVSEWYANGPLGLEQGFSLARSLAGGGEPLILALRVGGDLRPVLAHGGQSLVFDAAGTREVLRYRGLVASDARGRGLRAWLSLSGGRVLVHVNARGAVYPVRIDPLLQLAEFSVSSPTADNQTNSPVAISGSTIAVGEPAPAVGEGSDVVASLGSAYAVPEPSSGWADANNGIELAQLTASDGSPNDDLGESVAVSGSTIVVGAPDHRVAGNIQQGAVYVFTEPASGWQPATQTAELTASDGAPNDHLGESVAISGSTIVAGAAGQGAVYVFSEPVSGRWQDATQTAKLTASGGAPNDDLGQSVAISGSTIVAGAPGSDGGRGAVSLFSEPASGWQDATQTAELTASDGAVFDSLGWSVAVSGSTIAAAAPNHTIGGHSRQGTVYVFSEPASGWQNATQTAELTASDGSPNDHLGQSVAISDSTIVAGAPGNSIDGTYVFGYHKRLGALRLSYHLKGHQLTLTIRVPAGAIPPVSVSVSGSRGNWGFGLGGQATAHRGIATWRVTLTSRELHATKLSLSASAALATSATLTLHHL